MTDRKAISKKTRFEIFKRDLFTCQYCGATPPSAILHIDHIHPVAKGGKNGRENLITACQTCNLGKGATTLDAAPQGLAERAEEVKEREAQLAGYYEIFEAKRERIEDEAWRVAEILSPGCTKRGFQTSNLTSIKQFLGKLPFHTVLEAAEIAAAKATLPIQRFKYFCGVSWAMIREGK